MALPDDYDFAFELPATVALGNKFLRIVEARVGEEKQIVFVKTLTEEEYLEEMGIEEEEE